jgi:hypothetical protein
MKLSRSSRLVAALIALISMLFMQYAMASYACPGMIAGGEVAAMPTGMMDHQPASGCAGMDSVQPNLCHAYDHGGHQTLDKPEAPQVQPFAAVGLALTLRPIEIALPPAAAQSEFLELKRSTAPPLTIRHCCFRI